MSVTTVDREVTVTRRARVYRCDGPDCSAQVEVPESLNNELADAPMGWIIVYTVGPKNLRGASVVTAVAYYHSKSCLADAVVP